MLVFHISQHSGITTQQQANGIACFFEAITSKAMAKARYAADVTLATDHWNNDSTWFCKGIAKVSGAVAAFAENVMTWTSPMCSSSTFHSTVELSPSPREHRGTPIRKVPVSVPSATPCAPEFPPTLLGSTGSESKRQLADAPGKMEASNPRNGMIRGRPEETTATQDK